MAGALDTRVLWRAALGLLALDGAFALLVTLAAHSLPRSARPEPAPAPRAIVVPIANADRYPRLPAEPPAPPPRAIVVAIDHADRYPALPAPPPVPPTITVAIGAPPRPPDTAALTDGAGRAAPAASDRLFAAVAAPAGERGVRVSSIGADALRATPPGCALGEPAASTVDAADATAPAPAPVAIADGVPARPTAPRSADDRLIAAAPGLPLADAPRRAGGAVDTLPASARVPRGGVDEIAATAGEPAWSSEPPRPELLPAARPSPAVLLARWLPELSSPPHSAPLKAQFVQQLLPLVMQVNEGILQRRARAAALAPRLDAGQPLSEADARFVADLLQELRLDAWDTDEVMLRLDAVPLSMALAQAAQESGWGRSRPAREDNSLFGQMMFAAAARPQLQPFADLLETVEAYARNLNSFWAYAEFRRRRAALRARGEALDGHALVRFIERYSERGLGYVDTIRQLMRANNLFALDARGLDAALDQRARAAPALDTPELDVRELDGGPLETVAPADTAADRLLPGAAAPAAASHGMDN